MTKTLIYNSKIIVENALLADTFVKRFMGYMFRREPHYEAIIMLPCNSVHTFFMKFAIDVLFLNKDMEIIKKVDGLESGRIIMPIKEAKIVIEGRAGLFNEIR
jgi:uncharacterized membrane protein (UPF0127 family)